MRRYLNSIVLAAVLVAIAGIGLVKAQAEPSPIGIWSTAEDKSHVEIKDCGGKLCGTIIWLKEPMDDDGAEKHDKNNPDAAQQKRKIVGLPLLSGFVKSAEASDLWEKGTIYNPEDGKTYRCNMTLKDANTLRVRGYVGMPMFGKTQIWTRVH